MFLNFNGRVLREEEALLKAGNRGFRYGDGLFETMLVRAGGVRLLPLHWERLAVGLGLLRFDLPFPAGADMERQVLELCAANRLKGPCRARLTVFRGDGPLFNAPDAFPHYIIQVSALPAGAAGWDDTGVSLGVFPDGRKACDAFSGVKSNNYLLYTLAGMYARDRELDDCLVLNGHGRVAESTIANVFYVKGGRVCTPPLSEGCVAGVMRRHLLESLPAAGYRVEERVTGLSDLAGAEEVFLTNAVRGVRWVRELRTEGVTGEELGGGRSYAAGGGGVAREIFGAVVEKI